MNNDEFMNKIINEFFFQEERKQKESRQERIDALASVLSQQDAEVVVDLEDEIRAIGKKRIAELGAEFIKNRLNEPGLFSPGMLVNMLVVSPKKEA